MHLFEIVDSEQTPELVAADDGEVIFPSKTIFKAAMIDKTVKYLLDDSVGGDTIDGIRYLIANIYNCYTYPNVKLFSLLRNADEEHQELIMDIIGISQSQFGESCFLMIDGLAPRIIKKFKLEE